MAEDTPMAEAPNENQAPNQNGKRPREELYVLKDDPDQIHNVATDENYSKIKAQLNRKLMGQLKRLKDPRVTGDGMTFEKEPFVGEWKRPARSKPKKSKR